MHFDDFFSVTNTTNLSILALCFFKSRDLEILEIVDSCFLYCWCTVVVWVDSLLDFETIDFDEETLACLYFPEL